MDYQTDYQMEELLPIVAEATQKYTGCDSTSVTYEKAQMLMEGVMYCLEEYGRSVKYGLAGKAFSVREQYHAGMELVLEKASKIREIYNGMAWYFDDYGVEVLRDTIKKGIPEF